MSSPEPEDLDGLLPDSLLPESKGAAQPLRRTGKQVQSVQKAEARAEAERTALAEKANAAKLAQIVNLHISGFTLEQIGAATGHTGVEIDRMLATDMQRYVRSQPALRTYVRNWVSGKYTNLLDTVWDAATDKNHKDMFDAQDRALRILDRMSKLHGAEAPVQHDVQIDAAPDAVEKLVAALAAGQGQGYDMDIFDVPEEDIHEAVVLADERTEVSGNLADASDGDDAL